MSSIRELWDGSCAYTGWEHPADTEIAKYLIEHSYQEDNIIVVRLVNNSKRLVTAFSWKRLNDYPSRQTFDRLFEFLELHKNQKTLWSEILTLSI